MTGKTVSSRTKIQKSTDDDPKKKRGRLSDMDTREVSIVDRAANKREFLVIKRDTEVPKKTEDGSGADLPTAKITGER